MIVRLFRDKQARGEPISIESFVIDTIKSGIPWIIPRVNCIFSIETTEVKRAVYVGKVGVITVENTTAFSCVAVFSMAFRVY